jgi:hypothetical protein
LVTSVVGVPVPADRYTSYDVAVDAEGHVSIAVVCVASVVPATGDVLVTQTGTGRDDVIKVVLLLTSHPVAAPAAFFGTTYQLYVVAAVNAVAV